jgi:hypothetical protein
MATSAFPPTSDPAAGVSRPRRPLTAEGQPLVGQWLMGPAGRLFLPITPPILRIYLTKHQRRQRGILLALSAGVTAAVREVAAGQSEP